MTDAIVRALWRMIVLAPQPARVGDRRRVRDSAWALDARPPSSRRMWTGERAHRSPLRVPIALGPGGPAALLAAAPLLVLWGSSPAGGMACEHAHARAIDTGITAADTAVMRRIARKTWRFFETFVTPEDH